ncbi:MULTISPECIES: efflux transporter outer membrane subunit [Desulfococcus]|jgi:NodT family efflux transporter outer membrane factor (OMF) lipoprotein|uniref:RND efflux system, outer membrane lipoprotein, NodT family n=1 Tax=Desulfococcus multivorans DSM 2059 TaxID=1121405 RepID=S7TF88_DESML|nr:efflux transporter outer membrane subunit [Desulfococcus multivorans]AOY59873.1 efflux transporter, RND family, outer membrane lipoprotein [Desulfococcus multivorans]AQV02031.1 RND transporter [Desulfococcus multivorans]EPR35872.1 RND efflux system, outer membrane lipoprotein, NodT family [Desulfococcus multivorans DSM 2059]MDX9818540.1 efflux transporter outer membrane subunit [Desulfococcus multivorans]SJZ34435.1 efflux transporter, outer membrane factor (OMF) lipoprotein, NodT family [De
MKRNDDIFARRLQGRIRTAIGGLIVCWLLIWGCAPVGPDYVKPDIRTPDAWYARPPVSESSGKSDAGVLARWWETFDDPALTALIDAAVRRNLDMKQALSRVREARARQRGRRADLFPAVDAAASASKSRSSGKSGAGGTSELYWSGVDAAWELDVFGGLRRSLEASQADLAADEADFQDVKISLMAEVALNYIDVRTYQARLAVSRSNVATQEETWALLDTVHRSGLGDGLAAEQARYNLESSRSRIPDLKTGLAQALNRLDILTARPPGSVHEMLSAARPLPEVAIQAAIGVPADLLRRRPDIRRAERILAAETARVGVAEAERYPRFTLDGTIGLEALSLGDLLQTSSRQWRIGPALNWRIFDAGAIRSGIEIQTAIQEQAMLAYETAILNALEEVENALVAYVREQEKLTALKAATRSARSAADLAEQRFVSGLVGFTDVLDAQRSLLTFEDDAAASRGAVFANLVRLYKVLGGGWDVVRPAASETQPLIPVESHETTP